MSGNINPRTIMAPVAAFTMAGVLFLYTRSSIRAARSNAKSRREDERFRRQQHQQHQQREEAGR
ncbi:hypothetical protein MYCTH_2302818, partial [Thermothelomyces thermophilus ATCC 42464]